MELQPRSANTSLIPATILGSLPLPCCYLDEQLVYRFTNPAFDQLSGVATGALLGLHAQAAGCLQQILQLQESLLCPSESHIVFNCPDGGTNSSYQLQSVTDKDEQDNIRGYVVTCTPLVQAADEYHQMIGEVEDYAILLLDRHGNVRNWNKGAEKIKGYKEHEIIGKHFRIFYRQHDRERGLPEQLIETALHQGRAIHEGWRMKKNGSVFWGSIVITAIHDDKNQVIGFTKVTRDLTERKFAEDQLRRSAAELEAQNRELQQFAYIASHDMKEPLRKILLYNDILLSNMSEHVAAPAQPYLHKIVRAANRMQHLIEDVLEYSKISFLPELFTPVDLNTIVAEVLDFHQEQLTEASASVHVDQLPVVPGIAHQLQQLFDNLVSNAIKYREPSRPLAISINCDAGAPASRGNTTYKDKIRIRVRDNGIGFSMEYSEKIFELFQRLVGKTEYSGTGIGLALCKKIVQNHNGGIKASGSIQQGAVFEILLPAG